MKLFISPTYHGIDNGNGGGIRRIVDRQRAYFGNALVDTVDEADTVALHAGSLVRLRTDQKVIAHCHGLYWSKYTNWDQPADDINRAVITAMKLSDFITAPTEWVANSLRRGMYRPVDIVPHAVDEDWAPGGTNKGYVLWNKSRIDKVCDPKDVYAVADLLPNTEFRLTVGVQSKNIQITGLTPYADKTPVQEAGVYLATAQETFGIGILEALACGVPVVGWNWGGQAEILPKSWLATPGDSNHLSELIVWALENHDSLKDHCLDIASRYTWQSAMEQYEAIYTRSIDCGRRISVVIRNYNQSDLLPECIESVLSEVDLEQDEVIVLDDCSTDNSSEVAAQYPGITFIQPPTNQGIALAQDYGISRAQGRYIVPLDSDNMLTPNSLQILFEALEADRSTDIAYGRIKWLGIKDSAWPPDKFNFDLQLQHRNQIPCTCMYRRKVYEVAGPYRARCKVAEDADFWCRATSLGFVPKKVTDAETFAYRARVGSSSQIIKDWPWEQWYDWKGSPPFAAPGKPQAHSAEPIIVSIIIPVGEGHEYLLQDALDSIYTQSFKNWECIVVNDTGSDIPYKLPPWVFVLNTESGMGPAFARNLGLDYARGALWVPLDADDYLTTTALEDMLKLWRSNKTHYIYGDFYKNEVIHKTPDIACQILRTQMPHILPGLYPVLPTVRFDTKVGIAEDWDFVLQMQEAGYCGVRLDKPICRYRLNTGNRREKFTSKDKQMILSKWEDAKLAGCNACAQRAAAMQRSMGAIDPSSGDVVLVEYTGNSSKRYYPGVVSGRTYAFGTGQGLQEKYVLVEDISGFSGKPDFTVHSNVEDNTPIPV